MEELYACGKKVSRYFYLKPIELQAFIRYRGKYFSFLWQMVRDAHHPEPVEGGRWGGFLRGEKKRKWHTRLREEPIL